MSGGRSWDPSRFLIAYGVDPVRWADRHRIEPFTAPCYSCGRDRTTVLPFAQGRLRGLIAEPCPCGHPSPPYCLVGLFD